MLWILCGLGQVAPVPLLGMIQAYPLDFDALIQDRDAIADREERAAAVAAAGN